MRYIKIKMDVSDEDFIYLHRNLKEHLDQVKTYYQIRSWRFVE